MGDIRITGDTGAGETGSELEARGPHPVGVLHATFRSVLDPDRCLPTEIWYPADPAETGGEDAPHPLGLPHRASPERKPARRSAPLIVFSHGNSGFRQQSTFLTTHLASWGHVVVAPDHVGNTFTEMMALASDEARRERHLSARANRPHDLLSTIHALIDQGQLADRLPALDATRIFALGHSFGGWTALKLPALEARIRAVCCLAPASEPFVGRRAFADGELPLDPAIETLVLAARDDVLIDLDTSIRPLQDRLGSNARLEIIDRSDHFHFCDGIELLHGLHVKNPREGQKRPTRPYAELRSEAEMHGLLNARVARFFAGQS